MFHKLLLTSSNCELSLHYLRWYELGRSPFLYKTGILCMPNRNKSQGFAAYFTSNGQLWYDICKSLSHIDENQGHPCVCWLQCRIQSPARLYVTHVQKGGIFITWTRPPSWHTVVTNGCSCWKFNY